VVNSSDFESQNGQADRFSIYLFTERIQAMETGYGPRVEMPVRVNFELEICFLEGSLSGYLYVSLRSIDTMKDIFYQKTKTEFQQALSKSLAHENMTPLNSIMNLSSMIEVQLSEIVGQPSKTAFATVASKQKPKINGQKIKWIIDMLHVIWSNSKMLEYMTMSQLDSMRLQNRLYYQYSFAPKPAKQELEEYIRSYSKLIEDRQIRLEVEVLKKLPDDFNCCVDWRVFKGIMYHILSNAIKFCESKGRVKLRIVHEECDPLVTQNLLEIPEYIKFAFLKVSILNTGTGMSRHQLEKIQRFNLGSDKIQNAQESCGIGITTAKSLCASLKGELNINSYKDMGTMVHFTVMVSDMPFKFKRQDLEREDQDLTLSSMDSVCNLDSMSSQEFLNSQKSSTVSELDLNQIKMRKLVLKGMIPEQYSEWTRWVIDKTVHNYSKDMNHEYYKKKAR
jgi:signal transduction histidine kinase